MNGNALLLEELFRLEEDYDRAHRINVWDHKVAERITLKDADKQTWFNARVVGLRYITVGGKRYEICTPVWVRHARRFPIGTLLHIAIDGTLTKCASCETPITSTSGCGRVRQTCSDRCRQRLRRASMHPTSMHPTSMHPTSMHPTSMHPGIVDTYCDINRDIKVGNVYRFGRFTVEVVALAESFGKVWGSVFVGERNTAFYKAAFRLLCEGKSVKWVTRHLEEIRRESHKALPDWQANPYPADELRTSILSAARGVENMGGLAPEKAPEASEKLPESRPQQVERVDEQTLLRAILKQANPQWFGEQSASGRMKWRTVKRPMTPEDYVDHLQGTKVIGVMLLHGDKTALAVLDFDAHTGENLEFKKFQAELAAQNMREVCPWGLVAVETVFTGRGYHVWAVFAEQQDAKNVRVWMRDELTPFKVDMFPAQDDAGDRYGSLVRVPFGWNPKAEKWSHLICV